MQTPDLKRSTTPSLQAVSSHLPVTGLVEIDSNRVSVNCVYHRTKGILLRLSNHISDRVKVLTIPKYDESMIDDSSCMKPWLG